MIFIGGIICKKKYILEYSSDLRIYETTYMLVNENIKQYKIKQVDKQTNVYV